MHIDIDLSGLRFDQLSVCLGLFVGDLLSFAQTPERIEGQLVLGLLLNLSRGDTSPEHHIKQIAQVAAKHELLDALDVVVVILHTGVIGGTHARYTPAKEHILRDTGDGREHIAGGVDDILDA